jgi:hypothetical protein
MKNLMVDIETISVRTDACIVSIGAVFFDQGGPGETFYTAVDICAQPQSIIGRIEPSTVLFWMNHRDSFPDMDDAPDLKTALNRFFCFAGQDESPTDDWTSMVWSYGSNFDIPILQEASIRCGQYWPWGYRSARCARTVIELAKTVGFIPVCSRDHNALADAVEQAKNVSAACKVLGVKI